MIKKSGYYKPSFLSGINRENGIYASWCNGNTPPFDGDIQGSNP